MKIDNELILKLENLARLSLDEKERLQIRKDLENILDMVEKLQELDTEGIEPLKYMTTNHIGPRSDAPDNGSNRELLLKQAPVREEDYIVIPKVIKRG